MNIRFLLQLEAGFRFDHLYVGTESEMNNVSSVTDYYQRIYNDQDYFIFINFTSDNSRNRRGFRIEYHTGYN